MTLPPLEGIGYRLSSHKPALRLLAALYCDPQQVDEAGTRLHRLQRLRVISATFLHTFPYILLLVILGRWVLFSCLGLPARQQMTLALHAEHMILNLVFGLVFGLGVGLGGGLVGGLGVGLGGGLGGSLGGGLGGSLGVSLVGGLVFGLVFGLGVGLGGGLVIGLGGGLGVSLVGGLVGGLGGGLVGGLVGGLGGGLGFLLGYTVIFTRFYYLPAHWLFLWSRNLRGFRRYHPVFWDRVCVIPFPKLERLLVGYAEENPVDGRSEIERLISGYPSQRMAALRAKTVLTARDAGRVNGLLSLDDVLSALPEGERGFLAQTHVVREKVSSVCRQQLYANSLDRPFFREQAIMGLRAEINAFIAQVSGFHEPLASEFRRAAEAWLLIADGQLKAVQKERRREPTPQIFRAGNPVQRDAEAFVERPTIIATLENEIMANVGCPGILLYGRRRVGKSTVIKNLDGFLPKTITQLVISMQKPEAFSSESTLAGLLGREIRARYPAAYRFGPEPTDLITLYKFLGSCNGQLETDNHRLLVCIDEFEELDRGVGEKRFTEGLAKTLRESVQNHRSITWLFAGSHHFSELPNVRWSSYLVSLRTLELPPFTKAETQLLLTDPLRHSRRAKAKEGVRMFGTSFWGEGVVDRIHEYTAGWPHLVQLVASTIVDLSNTQGKNRCDSELLKEGLTKSIESGDAVLAELMLYRSDEYPGAWAYLSGFRTQQQQPPPAGDELRIALKRSLLIKETQERQWTLRVPMLGRWLRERT